MIRIVGSSSNPTPDRTAVRVMSSMGRPTEGAPGPDAAPLDAALTEARRLGFLGEGEIAAVVQHARWFVGALGALADGASILDLGSGGGIPGLVIANDRPSLSVTLIDRRAKRTDFLSRMVSR